MCQDPARVLTTEQATKDLRPVRANSFSGVADDVCVWELRSRKLPLKIDFSHSMVQRLWGVPAHMIVTHPRFVWVLAAMGVGLAFPSWVISKMSPPESIAAHAFPAVVWTAMLPCAMVVVLSLQKKLLVLALSRAGTWYRLGLNLVFHIAIAHRWYCGNSLLVFTCNLPTYIVTLIGFSVLAVADAVPPVLRTVLLRYGGPVTCMALLFQTVTPRLPGAEEHPGHRTFMVAGVESWSNSYAMAVSALVLLLMMSQGVYMAWFHPDQLPFWRSSTATVEVVMRRGWEDSPSMAEEQAEVEEEIQQLELQLRNCAAENTELKAGAEAESGPCAAVHVNPVMEDGISRSDTTQGSAESSPPWQGNTSFSVVSDADIGKGLPRQPRTSFSGIHDAALCELRSCSLPLRVDFRMSIVRQLCGMQVHAVVTHPRFVWGLTIVTVCLAVPSWCISMAVRHSLTATVFLAVSWTACFAFGVVVVLSLQKDVLILLLLETNTWYRLGLNVAFHVAIFHRAYCSSHSLLLFALTVPLFMGTLIGLAVLAIADAIPPVLRAVFLRYGGPVACMCLLYQTVVPRLPGAVEHPGHRTIVMAGVEIWNNSYAIAASALVLLVMMSRGVYMSWFRPNELPFWRSFTVMVDAEMQQDPIHKRDVHDPQDIWSRSELQAKIARLKTELRKHTGENGEPKLHAVADSSAPRPDWRAIAIEAVTEASESAGMEDLCVWPVAGRACC